MLIRTNAADEVHHNRETDKKFNDNFDSIFGKREPTALRNRMEYDRGKRNVKSK